MSYRIAIILAIFLLNACGQKEDTPPPKLFEDQRQVLDKAKDVSAQQQEEAEKQRKAIEQQAQ
jgi:outer membrane lipoprotein-sorting protein